MFPSHLTRQRHDPDKSSSPDETLNAKDPAAQALGSKGGKKRAERLSAEKRSEIARLAATARWKKK